MKPLLRWLIIAHRYVGLVFCLIFLAWFTSGIVMVYHRMPQYSVGERLARLAPLDADDIQMAPSEALASLGMIDRLQRLELTTYGSRPVYRFAASDGWRTVFADDGSELEALRPEDAVAVAGDAFPLYRESAQWTGEVSEPDQWTIGNDFSSSGPLHKVSLGDPSGTELYVATTTGEIEMKTDRASRTWGYIGPVLHWFYFRPLRVRGPLWAALIIYGSVIGCALCLSGLVIGVYRFSMARRFHGGTSPTPYSGWLRWHHYAGLTFGLLTFTWLFSGLLSMQPWGWSPGNGPTRDQVLAIRGSGIEVDRFDLPTVEALREFQQEFQPSVIEFRQFLGSAFYLAYAPPPFEDDGRLAMAGPRQSLLVRASGGERRADDLLGVEELGAAARAAMRGAIPIDAVWLTEYDAYYYGQGGDRPLPVLRARFADPLGTWLYLDARDGSLVQREVRRTRLERWLYRGLHSLDFPGLYQTGWAWYSAIVLLSMGGVALSFTSVVVAWRVLSARARV